MRPVARPPSPAVKLTVSGAFAVAMSGVALLPFLARATYLAGWLAGSPPPIHAVGDDAVLELYTLHAASGSQMVGPYSRFHWNHPGPTYFYALLPVWEMAGRHTIGVHLGALLVNASAAAGLIVWAWRAAGANLAHWVALLLAVHGALFAPLLSHPLNPFVAILPFLLFLAAASTVAAGRFGPLWLVAAAGSFAVQTHVGYAAVVVAVSVGCLVLGALERRRLETSPGDAGLARPLTAAAAAVAVLWALPVIEEISNRPGNLSQLIDFFAGATEAHAFAEAFPAFATWLSAAPVFIFNGMRSPGPAQVPLPLQTGLAILQALGLILAIRQARRSRWDPHGPLAAVGLIAYVAGLWSVTRIVGPIHYYLIIWLAGLGAFNWVVVGSALTVRFAPRAVGVVVGVLVVVATSANLLGALAAGPPRPSTESHDVGLLAGAVARQVGPGGRLRLHIATPEAWSFAAGMVLELEKRQRHVSVDPDWTWVFGPQHRPRGDEPVTLIVVDGSVFIDAAQVEMIARSNSGSVFELRSPDWNLSP